MKAAELHAHLSGYLAQSPLNAEAEVVLRDAHGAKVFVLAGANDAQVMGGSHLLILVPDTTNDGVEIRSVGLQ